MSESIGRSSTAHDNKASNSEYAEHDRGIHDELQKSYCRAIGSESRLDEGCQDDVHEHVEDIDRIAVLADHRQPPCGKNAFDDGLRPVSPRRRIDTGQNDRCRQDSGDWLVDQLRRPPCSSDAVRDQNYDGEHGDRRDGAAPRGIGVARRGVVDVWSRWRPVPRARWYRSA